MMITGNDDSAQENRHTIAGTIAVATAYCDHNIGTRARQAVCIDVFQNVTKILNACVIMETLKNIKSISK